MDTTFAEITPWLYVGNRQACGVPIFSACIHINRSDYPGNDCCRHAYPLQMEMDYRDGDELSPSIVANLLTFVCVLRKSRSKTLIHCHAGMCRSPTIAGYVLAAVDNLHPLDGFAAVERAIYDQQEKHSGGKICNTVYYPKRQLVRLLESKAHEQG